MLARLSSHRHGQPFAITVDPRVVFESTAFRSAFLALTDAIAARTGLVVLVGDPGCGKTMLLRTLRDAHARGSRPAFLRHAAATGDLLAALLSELRLDAIPGDRKGRLEALAECLAQRPGPALLLVDEGEELSPNQFAELAALADWRRGEPDNLQVVVAGRPEMKARIEQRLRAGAARPALATTRLGPLLRQEIGHYVAHHLALGRSPVLFSSTALDRLYMHSQGLPLKINLLCTCALSRRVRRIEAVDVDAAAHFCGLIPAPSSDAAGTAGRPAAHRALPRRASVVRRTGGRMLRFGYRTAGLAGLACLAFAIIHLVLSVGDMARHDEDVQLALGSRRQAAGVERAEPATRDYIAAAVKTLAEPSALLAPAILARPLTTARGTDGAQGTTAPLAPEAPQDRADETLPDQAVEAVNEAEGTIGPATTALDKNPAPGPQPPIADAGAPPDDSSQPIMSHLWPGSENEGLSGAAEPIRVEAAEPPPPAPAAPAPVAATPPPAAAPARDASSGAAVAPPTARAETLDTERLMRRGLALLQDGDVASARLFFERAAAAGHAAALTALGQSFDPLELQRLGVIGIKGDPGRALEWYRAADAAGDSAARERGARLSGWVERGRTVR